MESIADLGLSAVFPALRWFPSLVASWNCLQFVCGGVLCLENQIKCAESPSCVLTTLSASHEPTHQALYSAPTSKTSPDPPFTVSLLASSFPIHHLHQFSSVFSMHLCSSMSSLASLTLPTAKQPTTAATRLQTDAHHSPEDDS